MSVWYTNLRLERMAIDLEAMRKALPRLRQLAQWLDEAGALGPSYETLNIYHLLERHLAEAAYSLQNERGKVSQLMFGTHARRTTPLLIATDDEIRTS